MSELGTGRPIRAGFPPAVNMYVSDEMDRVREILLFGRSVVVQSITYAHITLRAILAISTGKRRISILLCVV
jgi:hypothetical protein